MRPASERDAPSKATISSLAKQSGLHAKHLGLYDKNVLSAKITLAIALWSKVMVHAIYRGRSLKYECIDPIKH